MNLNNLFLIAGGVGLYFFIKKRDAVKNDNQTKPNIHPVVMNNHNTGIVSPNLIVPIKDKVMPVVKSIVNQNIDRAGLTETYFDKRNFIIPDFSHALVPEDTSSNRNLSSMSNYSLTRDVQNTDQAFKNRKYLSKIAGIGANLTKNELDILINSGYVLKNIISLYDTVNPVMVDDINSKFDSLIKQNI